MAYIISTDVPFLISSSISLSYYVSFSFNVGGLAGESGLTSSKSALASVKVSIFSGEPYRRALSFNLCSSWSFYIFSVSSVLGFHLSLLLGCTVSL